MSLDMKQYIKHLLKLYLPTIHNGVNYKPMRLVPMIKIDTNPYQSNLLVHPIRIIIPISKVFISSLFSLLSSLSFPWHKQSIINPSTHLKLVGIDYKSLKLLLIIIIFSVTISARLPVFISFYDSVAVNSKKVVLGDIANIQCPKNEVIKIQLSKIKVGNSAPTEYSRYINVYEIIHKILAPQFQDIEIKTNNIERVKIYTKTYIRSIGKFKKKINKFVKDNVKWKQGEYLILLRNSTKEFRIYQKPFEVFVEGLQTPYPKGNIKLSLKIVQDSNTFNIPFLCRIKVTIPVLCAAEKIERNEVIKEHDIEFVTKDITAYRYEPITEIALIIGKKAIKTISPGTIIHKKCFKAIPDICKGDVVSILLKKGKIRISVPARAREYGRIGERIWVENLNSSKLVRVIIVNRQEVNLIQGESI